MFSLSKVLSTRSIDQNRAHLEQEIGKCEGLFEPHAAVAEAAAGAREQTFHRGVMETDVELVRNHELDAAQGIVGSRFLSEMIRKAAR